MSLDPILPIVKTANIRLYQHECLEILKSLPDDVVDSLVTDPPAGISFMGKDWDGNKGGKNEWIAWMKEVMQECLRVMKPGAHGLVWAIPRASHWTASACEDAGFEIRDVITHVFSTGFPKSLNIEKYLDKAEMLCQCSANETKTDLPGMSERIYSQEPNRMGASQEMQPGMLREMEIDQSNDSQAHEGHSPQGTKGLDGEIADSGEFENDWGIESGLGGRTIIEPQRGYVMIRSPKHPRARQNGYRSVP